MSGSPRSRMTRSYSVPMNQVDTGVPSRQRHPPRIRRFPDRGKGNPDRFSSSTTRILMCFRCQCITWTADGQTDCGFIDAKSKLLTCLPSGIVATVKPALAISALKVPRATCGWSGTDRGVTGAPSFVSTIWLPRCRATRQPGVPTHGRRVRSKQRECRHSILLPPRESSQSMAFQLAREP